ncbi:MAG: hypothetical protein KGL59_11645 [Acidobacteriota bacterium]|nr:hypothetical protein [Acidobacteriota bacterium]
MTRNAWRWLLVFVLVPLAAWGQQSGTQDTGTATASAPARTTVNVYGSGVEDRPSLADAGFVHNFLFLGADLSSRYDDNVRQTNSGRIADTGFVVSPEIAFRHEGGRVALAFRYRPTLLFYRHETGYDEQDHDLGFDGSLRATERLSFRARTDVVDRTGLLQSFWEPAALPALGPPGHLNDTVITPFANEFENNSRADMTYEVSARAELGVFTTYMLRSFGQPAQPQVTLFETEGRSAGARYVYRTTARTTLGLVYTHEELHIGPRTRLGMDTPSVGLTLALSPNVVLDVYGGPVYTRLRDTILLPLDPLVTLAFPNDRNDWRWAAGGGVTLRSGQTQLRLSGSHEVSDGGGLLDAVTSEMAEASLERRLTRKWTVGWTAGWERNASLPSALLQGSLEGEYGRIVVRHSITERVSAEAGYQFQRQRESGPAPIGANFDRNFVYITLTYQFKNIPLGR